MLDNITVSPAPHISKAHSTRSIMLDVLIGLSPAVIAACIYFRVSAVVLIVTCVLSCMATEYLCNLIRKKQNSLDDLSSVVTGLILALSLSPLMPYWAAIIGSVFCIAIGKMVFGGLGCNIFNPAMVGRTFLTASFGILMTTWAVPVTVMTPTDEVPLVKISAENTETDATTQATPLSWSKAAIKGQTTAQQPNSQLTAAFIGQTGGCLGETSALAILIGAGWLFYRKTITFDTPVAVLLGALVFSGIFWIADPEKFANPIFHLSTGGLLLCAFFISTDPVTAPLTRKGMWIFGAGIGILIMLIRIVGGYPEGVMYAVLIMNALAPLIDRFCKLTPAGGKK